MREATTPRSAVAIATIGRIMASRSIVGRTTPVAAKPGDEATRYRRPHHRGRSRRAGRSVARRRRGRPAGDRRRSSPSVSPSIRTVLSASSRPISVSCAASTSRRRAAAIRGWSRAASMRGSRPRMIAASGASGDWPASGARIRRLRSSASMSASNIAAASCSARYSRASGVVERAVHGLGEGRAIHDAPARPGRGVGRGDGRDEGEHEQRRQEGSEHRRSLAGHPPGPVGGSTHRRIRWSPASAVVAFDHSERSGPRGAASRFVASAERCVRKDRVVPRIVAWPNVAGTCTRLVTGGFRHDACRNPLRSVRSSATGAVHRRQTPAVSCLRGGTHRNVGPASRPSSA